VSAARTMASVNLLDVRTQGWTISGRVHSASFKLADMVKCRARDVLITIFLVTVLGVIWTNTFWTWWAHVVGTKNFKVNVFNFNQAYIGQPFAIPLDIVISHTTGGALATLLIFAAKMRFPGLPINPLGIFLAGLSPDWYGFPNIPVAFAIKWLSIKFGGVKFWETRVLPFLIGFSGGYGLNYVIIMWSAFILRVLPQIPL